MRNARLILNEVTSTNPSFLQAPIAVVGPRAHFILANPNGITVDGGSLVNPGNVALSSNRREKQNVDDDTKVKEAVNETRDNAMVRIFSAARSEAEVRQQGRGAQQYEIIKSGLGDVEYKPRIMLVQDEAAARGVIAQLRSGGSFDALARLYSTHRLPRAAERSIGSPSKRLRAQAGLRASRWPSRKR